MKPRARRFKAFPRNHKRQVILLEIACLFIVQLKRYITTSGAGEDKKALAKSNLLC
jgi:hypothetical protein